MYDPEEGPPERYFSKKNSTAQICGDLERWLPVDRSAIAIRSSLMDVNPKQFHRPQITVVHGLHSK